MAKKKKKSTLNKPKAWLNRLISAVIFIFCLLMILALAYGAQILKNDFEHLKTADGFAGWFSSSRQESSNLIGIFGILMGNFFVYLVGYVFSLLSFILIGIIALLYFLEPQAAKGKQKLLLFLIVIFLLQILISQDAQGSGYGIIPGALLSLLIAIFGELGSTIILVSAICLSIILILEWQRIKAWLIMFGNSFAFKEAKAKKEKPTINKDIPTATVKEAEFKESTPIIHDHVDVLPEPKEVNKESTAKKKDQTKKDKPKTEGDKHEYVIPSINDFLESPVKLSESDRKEIESQILSTSSILQSKLAEFGIEAEVRNVNIGPIITQYELEPAKGVKVNKFASLADDLALAIKAKSIRVQAPIPGRGLIGIEIPNHTRDMIYLKDLLLCEDMQNSKSKLMFGLGKDIAGKPVVTDLAKMPHLLIAGATGSGKSVCINTIIMSLILRSTPDEVRLILIDPKRVELAGYNELPHLIGNVITEPENALENLYWAVREMERRYELLQEAKVRDLASYNERAVQDKDLEQLPLIVIIVDEFADLIMTSGKDIELPITRLAQMARAVGIHLILATQRPSIKVITGIIKANFPARIAFQVSSRVDSRVILDMIGAERLLGSGDMLFLPPGKAISGRIHGAYVSDHEIARVCEFLAMQPKPEMDFAIEDKEEGSFGSFDYDDELFPEAAILVVRTNTASVSMFQRHFKIGYARAGRIIDLLERAQIIGPHLGSKSRDVLANREDLIRMGLIKEEE